MSPNLSLVSHIWHSRFSVVARRIAAISFVLSIISRHLKMVSVTFKIMIPENTGGAKEFFDNERSGGKDTSRI